MEKTPNLFSIFKGSPQPLGATSQNGGVNFAIYAPSTCSVTLCLFESPASQAIHEINLTNHTGNIWHAFLNPPPKELYYGYKVENTSIQGHFPHILLDPYAKGIQSCMDWGGDPSGKIPYRPLGIISPIKSFEWENIESPNIPMKDLIIYEMHIKGFTHHPSSGVSKKGKFLGVIEKIPYLKELGVNAIKLLPLQEFNETENHRINPVTYEKLFQYWGYSTVNYFTPMNRFASSNDPGASLLEFKTMVKELHRNGIEIILDIVFNHTAEGIKTGPVYSFKGIDPQVYYILNHEGDFKDYTGCGNTVNCNHPVVMELIQNALRYWVSEMHVDGFRFDLASIFYRDIHGDPITYSPLVEVLSRDPILARTKLIAEPWDATGMYQVGKYYPSSDRWSEWNGKYRDTVRRFMKSIPGQKREFASRICGSEDLYRGKSPSCSINYVTAHDGFTLADLVSYNSKHNIENGEDDRDGMSNNDSWNCGAEGATVDKKIVNLRERQKKNFIFALMISQGVPMIQMGDEYSHTKKGNNNSWCQDNNLSWFLWDSLENNRNFFRFYVNMIHFRKNHAILRQGRFFTNQDIDWHGQKPLQPDWDGERFFLAFTLKDHERGRDLYIAFNAQDNAVTVDLPPPQDNQRWHLVVNTAAASPMDFVDEAEQNPLPNLHLRLQPHSAILLIIK